MMFSRAQLEPWGGWGRVDGGEEIELWDGV